MNADVAGIRDLSSQLLNSWLHSCTRRGKISRNTIAVGIVVFDHLRRACPIARDEVVSSGGEIKGSRGALSGILAQYGISDRFLKEATTRQTHQDGQRLLDAFKWGDVLCPLLPAERDQLLLDLIASLAQMATAWLKRQNLKLDINRAKTPTSWIHLILDNAEGRSGGVVEQHLVGAKLARRYPTTAIPNHPAHAGDAQTERGGDFEIQKMIYHVTGAPGTRVIEKCAANLQVGLYPILLIPQSKKGQAIALAEVAGIADRITILSIEDFVALNIIEMATGEQRDFFSVLKDLVDIYNKRLAEVETDMSLQIEIR